MSKYKELLRSRVESAINQARVTQSYIEHNGLKGEIIEILIKELFRPLLPADIGVASGQIIDSKGKISKQQDVVIFDQSILPPVLFESKKGLFPVECVLYSIEIKTTLTAKELQTTHDSARKLFELEYLSGNEINPNPDRIRSVLFALNSDLTTEGKSEAIRYRELYASDYPYIRAICVAEKEYWHESNGSWIKHHIHEQFDEILSFIGGIMNTYKSVSRNRGLQCLGHYIIDSPENVDLITIASGTSKVIKANCDQCGAMAVLTLNMPDILNVAEIISNTKCKCGGVFRAPGGKYALQDGEYIRVGEYEVL